MPVHLKAIEENTVPSWLWQHNGAGKATQMENSVRHVFDRFVGAALYKGWKQHLFAQESDAQIYFDETRYALTQRMLVLEPALLARAGLDWAYGLTSPQTKTATHPSMPTSIEIDNHTIDTIVSGRTHKSAHAIWQQALAFRTSQAPVQLRFVDTMKQWGTSVAPNLPIQAAAAIDLLALRHNDGSLNIDLLKQTARLAIITLDLHNDHGVEQPISYFNLAPLLMGMAIAYDSDEARATAAAISGIITAEVYITLAELARLRGKNAAFTLNIDSIMRTLRNHCRAAYGDHADYEKTSIMPIPLELKAGADLTLIAEAQRSWDKALDAARAHGLRHIHATCFGVSSTLAFLTETAAQNIAPLPALINLRGEDGETFRREIHPSVTEALTRLKYDRAQTKAITAYSVGHQSLKNAPAINQVTLRKLGFDQDAFERIEKLFALRR